MKRWVSWLFVGVKSCWTTMYTLQKMPWHVLLRPGEGVQMVSQSETSARLQDLVRCYISWTMPQNRVFWRCVKGGKCSTTWAKWVQVRTFKAYKARVSKLVVDLGWVDWILNIPLSAKLLPWLMGIWQMWLSSLARRWNSQIKVDPTRVYDKLGRPVEVLEFFPTSFYLAWTVLQL